VQVIRIVLGTDDVLSTYILEALMTVMKSMHRGEGGKWHEIDEWMEKNQG